MMRMLAIIAATVFAQATNGRPPTHRVLIVTKAPSASQARLLEDLSRTVGTQDAKELGLQRVVQADLEMLVENDLWDHPALQLSLSAIRALGTLDGSKPISLRQLPLSVRQAILDRLNGEVRPRSGPAFNENSELTFQHYSEVEVSDGVTSKVLSVRGTPSPRAGVPAGSPVAAKPLAMSSPNPKRSRQIYFSSLLADREYWRLNREVDIILNDHRLAMEKAFEDESKAISGKLFPAASRNASIRSGDRIEGLPPSLQRDLSQQTRNMDQATALRFRENAQVTNARTSLVLVFHYGRAELTYSPLSLFELP